MSSRAVQEPDAWFACNGGYFSDTQDTKGGLAITFRGHTGSSGYLFRNTGTTAFSLGIEESEGTAELTATCLGITRTYSVTLDEWHTVIWAPVNNIFKIDGTDQGFSGSVTSITAVPLRFCSGATDIDIATISKWNTYTDDEAAYSRNFVPQSDGRYYDTVNRQYFSISGTAPVYYTPETDPWKPAPEPTTGWLVYSQSAGTGTTQITLTAPDYTDIVQRTAFLRIEGANGSVVYLTAVQNAYEPDFSVQPSSLEYEWTGGTLTLQVESQYSWTLEAPDWAHTNVSSGSSGSTSVQVTAEANMETSLRSGIMAFKNESGATLGTVSVQQALNNVEGNVVIYTTTDKAVAGWAAGSSSNPIVANYYEGDYGYIVFSDTLVEVPLNFLNAGTNTGMNQTLETVILPEGVTDIGNYSFEYNRNMISISLPSTVENIGTNTFQDCESLPSVSFPPSLKSIGVSAFRGCDSLSSVTFSDCNADIDGFSGLNITDVVFGDGSSSGSASMSVSGFANNRSLSSITFNQPVTIEESAFANDSALPSVTFNQPVTVKTAAFSGCGNGTGSLILNENVTLEGTDNFRGSNFSSVTVTGPSAVTQSCFYGAHMTSCTIGDSVVSVGVAAFYQCTSLEELHIGSGCTGLGASALRECSALDYITIEATTPPSVDYYSTFQDIKSGGTLIFPFESRSEYYDTWLDGKSTVDLKAYEWNRGRANPSAITITDEEQSAEVVFSPNNCDYWQIVSGDNAYVAVSPSSGTGPDNTDITFSRTFDSLYMDYSATYTVSNGLYDTAIRVQVEGNETELPTPDSYHIYYLSTDYEVIAPNNLSYVSNEILQNGLGVITLEEPLSQLPSDFFREKSTLKRIAFPSSLYIIGDYALYNCDSLTDIQFGGGEIAIGFEGIGGCNNLTGYTLPQSIVSIGPCGLGGMYPTVSTAGAELIEFGPDLAELWNASLCGLGNVKRMNFYGMTPPVLHYGQNVNPPYDDFGVFDYINPECVIHTPSGSDYSVFYTYGLPESVSIIPDLQAKEPSAYSVVTVKTQGTTSFDGSTNQTIDGYFDSTYGAVINKKTAPFIGDKWLVYVPSVDGESGLDITGGDSFTKTTTHIGESDWFLVSIVPRNFNTGATISEDVTFVNANDIGDTVSFGIEQKGGAGALSVSSYYPSSAECYGMYFQTTNLPGNSLLSTSTIAKRQSGDGTIRLTPGDVGEDGRIYCTISRNNVLSQQILQARFLDTFGNFICVGFTLGRYGVD